MPNHDITRIRDQNWLIVPPLALMLLLWTVGVVHWLNYEQPLVLALLGYAGLISGAGIGGYIAAADRYRPYARRLVILLVGSLLLAAAFLTDHGNMHMEGFYFALLAGGGGYVLLHFALAKIIGPLAFGRVWCGWACWYAMIFDLLPYPFSHYRREGRWGLLRYAHAGIGLLLVLVLWFGFRMNGATGRLGVVWFGIGTLAYYAVGVTMALVLRDNRAFCKYLCPLAVPLKASAAYSLVKVSGVPDHCEGCEACVEMCPMDIRVKDYITSGQRVLSTECTLCATCINTCPHDSLRLSLGLDRGGREIIDFDPSPGNRETTPVR